MEPGRLIWISLPGYTFGLVVRGGRVVEAAPIAHWTLGKPEQDVAAHFLRRGADIRPIDPLP